LCILNCTGMQGPLFFGHSHTAAPEQSKEECCHPVCFSLLQFTLCFIFVWYDAVIGFVFVHLWCFLWVFEGSSDWDISICSLFHMYINVRLWRGLVGFDFLMRNCFHWYCCLMWKESQHLRFRKTVYWTFVRYQVCSVTCCMFVWSLVCCCPRLFTTLFTRQYCKRYHTAHP
jgi:hypothetical protein